MAIENHETTSASESWRHEKSLHVARLATRMVQLYHLDFNTPQSPEYEAVAYEYLWQSYELAEHDKFEGPDYGNHRRG